MTALTAKTIAVDTILKSDGTTPWDFVASSPPPTTPPVGTEGSTVFVGQIAFDPDGSPMFWNGVQYQYVSGLVLQQYILDLPSNQGTFGNQQPTTIAGKSFAPKSKNSKIRISLDAQINSNTQNIDAGNPFMYIRLKKNGVILTSTSARAGFGVQGFWQSSASLFYQEASSGVPETWEIEVESWRSGASIDLALRSMYWVIEEVTG